MSHEKTSLAIKVLPADESGKSSAIFALKLDSIVATVSDRYSMDNEISKQLKNQVDLINSMYSAGGKHAFELIYINHRRAPDSFEDHDLRVALMAKVSSADAIKDAEQLSKLLPVILSGRLSNYEFCGIDNLDTLEALINPFPYNYVAEIRRRHQMIPVSTLKKESTAGFFSAGQSSCDQDCVYFVFPFINRASDFSGFVRMLLDLNQNIVVSCLLLPTVLLKEEIDFINEQIIKCEQARTTYSGTSQGFSSRTSALISIYEEQLSSLLDASYLMQIRIASDEPISSNLLEALGVEITEYQSYQFQFSRNYYSGGYDIVCPTEEEKDKALQAFQNLEPHFFSHPQRFGRWRFLFDAAEAGTAFRLPLAINDNLVGLKVVHVKPLPLPKEVQELARSTSGKTKVGVHSWSASTTPVYISDEDRLRHVYIIGQTGTGKTTLLKNMILEDLKKGNGVIVLDPHGDLFYEICGLIPESRMDDVVVLNPADIEHPVGFNLIEWQTREEKYFLIKEMQEIIKRMLEDEYGEITAAEITGTLFYHFVEMVLLLLMSHPEKKATIYDFYEFFQSEDKKKEWAVDPDRYDDPTLRSWVKNMLPQLNLLKRGEDNNISIGEFISGKFKEFIFDPKLRAIFSQENSTINISEIMNNGKVLLVNLAKGELSARGSRFLGMVLMSRIMISAMERIKIPKEKRRPVYIYVDEFQNIATSSFSTLISEARKFGVGLVLANQFLAQIKRRNIYESILGNVATWVAFRVGLSDATLLEDVFLPTVNSSNLVNLPNWQAAVRTSIKGRGVLPFYIKTEESPESDDEVENTVIELSRSKYSIKINNSGQACSLVDEEMTLSEAIKLKREEEERRLDELRRIEQEIMEKLEALRKRKQDK